MRSELDDVARSCIGYRTRMAALNVTRIYNAALRPIELPITQFLILVAIGRDAARTQDGYAGVLGLERTTFLRNLKLLTERGLVARDAPATGSPYSLTGEGSALVARALPLWREAQQAIVAAIGAQSIDQTYDTLRRLARLSQDG